MTSFLLGDHPPAQVLPPEEAAQTRASGRIDLLFAADAQERTYIKRQFAAYPFHICRALYHDVAYPGLATLYVQSCSGGLYEDDRLGIAIETESGAAAHVTTQSSTVVHSMPSGSAAQHTWLKARPRSYLEYLPDPQILFPQSRSSSTIRIEISPDARVLVSDSVLLHDPAGRDGVFSSYLSEIVIEDDAGRRLAVDRMNLDGTILKSGHPGILGAFSAQGTVIAAGLEPLPDATLSEFASLGSEAVVGVSLLPKSAGTIVRVLASDGVTLRREMHRVWSVFRFSLKGNRPPEQRK